MVHWDLKNWKKHIKLWIILVPELSLSVCRMPLHNECTALWENVTSGINFTNPGGWVATTLLLQTVTICQICGQMSKLAHKLITITSIASSPQTSPPFIMATGDAERAYDKVKWSFLITSRKHFGFSAEFSPIGWTNLATASVITNGVTFQPFRLKEARQGWKEGKAQHAHFLPRSHFVNPSQNLKPIQHKISLYRV